MKPGPPISISVPHGFAVTTGILTDDGRVAATAGGTNVWVWPTDLQSTNNILVLHTPHRIDSVAFSRDPRRPVATCSAPQIHRRTA